MVRRKGYVRQGFTRLFEALHDDGMPLSTLYPFRESFYDRLGYVTFPQPRMATIDSSALLPLMKWNLQGTFELLTIADGYDRYRAFLERQQQQIHGMGLFGPGLAAAIRKANRSWLLVAEVDGEEVGMMTYRIEGQGKNLVSRAFFPVDTRGRYLLLEWMARHADQVKDIELKLPPSMQPETWLPDLNVKISAGYPPMGRVIDVRGLEGMQTGNARFTARITDVHCPWNAGTFAFESTEGVLHITATTEAECNLTIQGLTALVYGAHGPADFTLRGWGDPSPAVQARMRTLFPAMLPYLHEVF
jgi:predicted acetyltransferase